MTGHKADKKSVTERGEASDSPRIPSRRDLLKGAGLVGAAVAGGATTKVIGAEDQATTTTPPQAREALENLTAAEAETLEAMTDRIIPSDENGPGAREARAVHFIDRALSSDLASSRSSYASGLAALDDFSRKQNGHPFHELSRDLQDRF